MPHFGQATPTNPSHVPEVLFYGRAAVEDVEVQPFVVLTELEDFLEALALATRAVITAHVAPVMMRWDGGTPTAVSGHLISDKAERPSVVVGNKNIIQLSFFPLTSEMSIPALGEVCITLER